LVKKLGHFLNLQFFFSFDKASYLSQIKTSKSTISISKRYSSLEVLFSPKKGVGFADIKIKGKKLS